MLATYLDAYLDALKDVRESDLRQFVASNADVDVIFHAEMVTAFGLYQTLEEQEKHIIRVEASKMTIEEVLAHIADLNPPLFDAIERMHAEGIPVVQWLKRQLKRGQGCARRV